jgi:hypothetical protein
LVSDRKRWRLTLVDLAEEHHSGEATGGDCVSLLRPTISLDEMLTRWDIQKSWGGTRRFLNGMSVLSLVLKFMKQGILMVLSLPLAEVCTSAKLSLISIVGN